MKKETQFKDGTDILVIKYDSNGIQQWMKHLASPSYESIVDIDSDTYGNIFLTGNGEGIFFIKYDSIGTRHWRKLLETST